MNESELRPKNGELRYPVEWASKVFNQARASHPRAWEIVMRYSGLSARAMAIFIATGSPAWPKFKAIAHSMSDWWRKCPLDKQTGENTRRMLSMEFVEKFGIDPKGPLDTLTGLF